MIISHHVSSHNNTPPVVFWSARHFTNVCMWNFPLNSHVRFWSVRRAVCQKGGKIHFHAPIEALVSFLLEKIDMNKVVWPYIDFFVSWNNFTIIAYVYFLSLEI